MGLQGGGPAAAAASSGTHLLRHAGQQLPCHASFGALLCLCQCYTAAGALFLHSASRYIVLS
jgi:hypothetical protein